MSSQPDLPQHVIAAATGTVMRAARNSLDAALLLDALGLTGRKQPPTQRDTCGTAKGYVAHDRHDETPCTDCSRAWAEKQRPSRRSTKEDLRWPAI